MSAEILIMSSHQRARFADTARVEPKARRTAYDDRAVDVAQLEQRLKSFIEMLPKTTRATLDLTNERLTQFRVAHRAGAAADTMMSRVQRAQLRLVGRMATGIA